MTDMLKGSVILVADDDQQIGELFQDMLEPEGATVHLVADGKSAQEVIARHEPDLAILDVRMPAPNGIELLQELRAAGNDLPVLIITAQDSSTLTIEAMRQGAYDYVAKPFDPDEVLLVVSRALEHRRLTQRVSALEQQVQPDPRDLMIGRSSPMLQIYKLIGRVAGSDATVLITGESGTGKELVAQVLHRSSPRADEPFVAVNCAALPETLLESELFGHEKGAFTGAVAQRKGRFEQANKGTLFLDEVGEMSLSTQKKLLRVLQERTFERVGGNTPVKVNVRVIAATNRDLLADTTNGSFRDDLYYRLNVINIHMPPLRERKDDIPLLVAHFLDRVGRRARTPPPRISEAAMELVTAYDWPGNVRQLQNGIERAVVLSQARVIGPEHIALGADVPPDHNLDSALARLLDSGHPLETLLADLRGRIVALALERTGNDRDAAARLLGLDAAEIATA